MGETLVISNSEYEILGLKIGRISFERKFNQEDIINCIVENNLDILRIRIENPDRDIYALLDYLPYKYYLLNILQVFEFSFNSDPEPMQLHQLFFKSYISQEDKSTMIDLVKKSFATNGGSYYYNPGSVGKYSSADEINSMAAYMAEQFHDDITRWTKLVYYNDAVVGFVSYYLNEQFAVGDMFGVLPEYQKMGIGREIGNYVLHELGKIKRVKNCVHIQHTASLNLHYSLGMHPTGVVLNFHINNI